MKKERYRGFTKCIRSRSISNISFGLLQQNKDERGQFGHDDDDREEIGEYHLDW